jgi:hypothetical protein
VDPGYQGLQKLHAATQWSKKKTQQGPLSKQDRKNNQTLASELALNENVSALLKRFKIMVDRYLNRRKRFALRFNLIAAIDNLDVFS